MAKSKRPAKKVTKKTVTGKSITGETATRRRPQTITTEEVQELAGKLASSGSGNIYAMCRNHFNIECSEPGDDEYLFDRIKKQCGVFRCERCSQWLDTSELSAMTDVCESCLDEANHDE